MLATLLLLAQLVLPDPPSGPIQPPGIICASGGCEGGPVVWGPAERGRLVVACDMRSDTCSDGRKITTIRPTPVPCEVSPGVWEMVPENTGCYSVRGLESWVANTSYLSYGRELDRSPWIVEQGTLAKEDGFYRLSGPVGSNVVQRLGTATEQTTYTFACILRGTGQARMQFSGPQVISLSPEWRQYSRTASISAGGVIQPRIYTGDGSSTSDPVDIMGCWLTRTDTPGRACWGGEAPVTCAADRHTISTEGWPTASGEVCLTANVSRPSGTAVILDGRPGFVPQGPLLSMPASNRINWISSGTTLQGPVVSKSVNHRICAGRRDGKLTLSVNGVSVPPLDGPALAWEPRAILGESVGGGQNIDGHISSLTVRSYEEVSP